ncbi:uncharacterized protein MONOS_17191 [Monocercomonoides exilis]|uniref:uncharacterized protein n=1 Tax=Monocercomonoides exilis TaxID=2049356 RepID=UPI00355AB578|nr:hypothetical protein MONOS_17191 [Monocercomonoides exilis]
MAAQQSQVRMGGGRGKCGAQTCGADTHAKKISDSVLEFGQEGRGQKTHIVLTKWLAVLVHKSAVERKRFECSLLFVRCTTKATKRKRMKRKAMKKNSGAK